MGHRRRGGALLRIYHNRSRKTSQCRFPGTQVAVAQIVVGAVIFLIVLIVVHLITARLSDAILDSRIGMIDRILGFLFGVVRGFVLIVIPYMFEPSSPSEHALPVGARGQDAALHQGHWRFDALC